MDYFQGSVAQEDVKFVTELVTETVVGENFSQLMVFIEATKYVETPAAFTPVATGIAMATVTKDNYALVTKGLLKTWLDDFFAEQMLAKAFLVTITPDLAAVGDWDPDVLIEAFGLLKGKPYFKSICITAPVTFVETYLPAAAVDLAELCNADTATSGPALLPLTIADPATIATDPVYAALDTAEQDAYCVYHPNTAHNGALLSLGIALSVINGSGTAVGNNFDFVATDAINASGAAGAPLAIVTQDLLKSLNIAYCKYVGEPNGTAIVVGAKTLKGKNVSAYWLVAYCNYVNRIYTSKYITKMGTFRNDKTYQGILLITSNTVQKFVDAGRLTNFVVTAPPFASLPAGTDTIIVPNAWKADFLDNVRTVQVYGQLTIGG